jgi:cysteine synthase
MGKRAKSSPFDFPTRVEDAKARGRAVALLKENGIRLPTFAELAEPARVPKDIRAALAGVGPDDAHPLNLYRVHWFNDRSRKAQAATPAHIELP